MLLLAFAGFSWVFGVRGDFCMPDAGRCENTVQKEGQIILQGGGDLQGTPPGDPPGGPQHHLNPRMGGQRGEPDNISQPVDPGGVGGFVQFFVGLHG